MLLVIILNFLVRSGRLNKVILQLKNAYKQQSLKLFKAGGIVVLIFSSLTANSYPYNFFSYYNDPLPVPAGINNQLFYLQRDPDANTVIYKLNIINGRLDHDEPVRAYWIKYADGGRISQLTTLQRKLAYGLQSRQIEKSKFELRFVSYTKLPLYLVTSETSHYVYAQVQQHRLILNRVFVRVKKASFDLPKVLYIELYGKDAESGKELTHRITI